MKQERGVEGGKGDDRLVEELRGDVRASTEGSCLRFFELEDEEGFPGSAGFCQSPARQHDRAIATEIEGSTRTEGEDEP